MRSITPKTQKRTSKNGTPIYSGTRIIGYVDGGTFYKRISFSTGLLKQPPAIMNDIDALKDAELLGATLANVTDRDTGNIYTAAISLIWQMPIYKNYGYGEQIGLALREWTKNGEPPASMPIKAAKPAPEAVQARLL